MPVAAVLVILRRLVSVRTRLLSFLSVRAGVLRLASPLVPALEGVWPSGRLLGGPPPGSKRSASIERVRLVSTAASMDQDVLAYFLDYFIFVEKVHLPFGGMNVDIDSLWVDLEAEVDEGMSAFSGGSAAYVCSTALRILVDSTHLWLMNSSKVVFL